MNRMLPSVIVCLLLVGVTLGVYGRTVCFEFVSYDDSLYVTENEQVQGGLTAEGFAWAFTTGHASNWHPLTWLSHMLDCELFALNPAGHHATNVLLHVANALLLFGVLKAMSGALGPSAVAAALFALHPLHVESVAWVAERKDVLSAFFGLLAMGAYVRYARQPRWPPYLLTALLFTLSLMAKPMLVTLPLVFLLLDFWPLSRRRSSALVVEKIPLLAISAASSAATFVAQQSSGVVGDLDEIPLRLRAANAVVSYVRYLGKTFWPQDLTVHYPHPNFAGGTSWESWQVAGAAGIVAAISLAVLLLARRHPYLVTGWLWYLGTLVPAIGMVQVGSQAMADRYTYVPLVGVFIMIAWGGADLVRRARSNFVAGAAAATSTVAVLVALAVCTWFQLDHWRNSVTLFERALQVTPGNPTMLYALGYAHHQLKNYDLAEANYTKAIEIRPGYAAAHYNRGLTHESMGRRAIAIADYSKAIELKPSDARAYVARARAYDETGKVDAAIADFSKAIELEPDFGKAYSGRADVYLRLGEPELALADYDQAIELAPRVAGVYNNRGNAHHQAGRHQQAIADYTQAIEIEPGYARAYYNRGNAYREMGRDEWALHEYNRAIKLEPDNVQAYKNRAVLAFQKRQFDAAQADAKMVEQLGGTLHPDFIKALDEAAGRSEAP